MVYMHAQHATTVGRSKQKFALFSGKLHWGQCITGTIPWGLDRKKSLVNAQHLISLYDRCRLAKNNKSYANEKLCSVVNSMLVRCLCSNVKTLKNVKIMFPSQNPSKLTIHTSTYVHQNPFFFRLLVPVVVLDTTVCASDIVGGVFFYVDPYFNKEICLCSTSYLPAYFVIRLVSFLFECWRTMRVTFQHSY